MRGKFLLTAIVVSLVLLPVLRPATLAAEETTDEYGCGERIKGSGEEVVRPEKIHSPGVALSLRELEKWGPIRVSGMIGCDGKVHDLEIDKELPESWRPSCERTSANGGSGPRPSPASRWR